MTYQPSGTPSYDYSHSGSSSYGTPLETTSDMDRVYGYGGYGYETPPRPRRFRHVVRVLRFLWRWIFRAIKAFTVLVVAICIWTTALIWITPPTSSFMLQSDRSVIYQWVDMDHISRYMVASAIVHEDPRFGVRKGPVDFDAFKKRVDDWWNDRPDKSGSTIPQQLAKNMYLIPGGGSLRKGLELLFATPASYILPDSRELELYLNYAQFGPDIYGICAASWYYFDTPPYEMTPNQGAQLASVLPLPSLARRANDGGIYVLGPESDTKFQYSTYTFIPKNMKYLGGYGSVVARAGIRDNASNHEHKGKDACTTMPAAVAKKLKDLGYTQ